MAAGLLQLERLHKDAIRRGNQSALPLLRRLHMLTVGMMAEARLRKVLVDPGGFNDLERDSLRRARSQIDRWRLAVELAFRRQYAVLLHRTLDEDSLGLDAAARHSKILALLDGHLVTLISDRNKTAHAQWAWQLNSGETAFTGRAPRPLNYTAIKSRSEAIGIIGDIVHTLIVSEKTFQRDFDVLVQKLGVVEPLLDGDTHEDFVAALRRQRRSAVQGLTST